MAVLALPMAVLALVLRALGVTILLMTVLVPAVDHHALARLPAPPPPRAGPAANADPVHELITHHHPQGSSRAVAVGGGDLPTLPAFLPTGPGRCGDAAVRLIAAGVASFTGRVLAAFPVVDPASGPWPSLAEPPPLPPPRLPA